MVMKSRSIKYKKVKKKGRTYYVLKQKYKKKAKRKKKKR